MLFDLRGKRRRTVQITYVGLAFLMAVGLIGAGVGSGVSGGIFDLFSGGGGSSTADKTVQKKIDRAEKALRANPKDEAAMESIVRGHYQLASLDTNDKTGRFGKDGKKELRKADVAWQRYLDSNPKKPDDSLAGVMVIAYSPLGLDDAAGAAGAAEVVATVRDNPAAWLQLVQFATAAGQTRKADLAAKKAVDVAPKNQKKNVKKEIPKYKQAGAPQRGGGAASGGTPPVQTPPGG